MRTRKLRSGAAAAEASATRAPRSLAAASSASACSSGAAPAAARSALFRASRSSAAAAGRAAARSSWPRDAPPPKKNTARPASRARARITGRTLRFMLVLSLSRACGGRSSRARSAGHGAADAAADGARLLFGVDVLGQADDVAERMADPGHRRIPAHEDAPDQALELAALHARAAQEAREAQPARDHGGRQGRRAQPHEPA